jgi:hypothetical protein
MGRRAASPSGDFTPIQEANMSKKLIARLSGLGLVLVAGGVLSTAVSALAGGGGGGINCPDVWNPVLCPNGQVYSNACYAGLAKQRNCVPFGDT